MGCTAGQRGEDDGGGKHVMLAQVRSLDVRNKVAVPSVSKEFVNVPECGADV